jgi:hypothetical protein
MLQAFPVFLMIAFSYKVWRRAAPCGGSPPVVACVPAGVGTAGTETDTANFALFTPYCTSSRTVIFF